MSSLGELRRRPDMGQTFEHLMYATEVMSFLRACDEVGRRLTTTGRRARWGASGSATHGPWADAMGCRENAKHLDGADWMPTPPPPKQIVSVSGHLAYNPRGPKHSAHLIKILYLCSMVIEIQNRIQIGFALGFSYYSSEEIANYNELILYFGLLSIHFKK